MPLEGRYAPTRRDAVREQVELYESSGGTEGTTLDGYPVVVITSRGARSGHLRKNPVMRIEKDGDYCVVASLGGAPRHPDWYFNVKANPLVDLQDGPAKQPMLATEASGAERERWWERAVAAFPRYAEYQRSTSRLIPLFVLRPAGGEER